ncbi:hypothetical protein PSAB6_420040 [Paraburkholderia sabiae]|nr:hypothetical protein PSAB6_420040 [Paraburkholderia sabiae]
MPVVTDIEEVTVRRRHPGGALALSLIEYRIFIDSVSEAMSLNPSDAAFWGE